MKVAITVERDTRDSKVDSRFGRAPFFALCNTDTGEIDFISNAQNLSAPSGAGIQAAQNVAAAGAQTVITGNCGPKAFKVLSAAGIKIVIGAEGLLEDVLSKFKNNEYLFADEANVETHWS